MRNPTNIKQSLGLTIVRAVPVSQYSCDCQCSCTTQMNTMGGARIYPRQPCHVAITTAVYADVSAALRLTSVVGVVKLTLGVAGDAGSAIASAPVRLLSLSGSVLCVCVLERDCVSIELCVCASEDSTHTTPTDGMCIIDFLLDSN